jgi:hypothetical protein
MSGDYIADETWPTVAKDDEQLLRDLADFGTSERVAALDKIRWMIEKGERDASLLDARDHDPQPYNEALRLLDLLRARERERVGE